MLTELLFFAYFSIKYGTKNKIYYIKNIIIFKIQPFFRFSTVWIISYW